MILAKLMNNTNTTLHAGIQQIVAKLINNTDMTLSRRLLCSLQVQMSNKVHLSYGMTQAYFKSDKKMNLNEIWRDGKWILLTQNGVQWQNRVQLTRIFSLWFLLLLPSFKSHRLDFRQNALFMVIRSFAVKQVHTKMVQCPRKGTLSRPSLSFSCCAKRYGTVVTKHSVQSNYIVNTAVCTTSSAYIVIQRC